MPKYNGSDQLDCNRARLYLEKLIEGGDFFDIIKKTKRSLNQNRYYHLLVGILSMETGHSTDDIYDFIKIEWCPDIYKIRKEIMGEEIVKLRSSADLTMPEMTEVIQVMRKRSEEIGIFLPDADYTYENQLNLEKELSRMGYY